MVVSITDSGMGNRIKSLISVMRLDDNYRVVWPINRFGNNKFNDLFENNIAIDQVPKGVETRFSPYFLLLDSDGIEEGFSKPHYDHKHQNYKVINNGKSIDWQYNKIPDNIKEIYVNNINKLIPIKYIRDEVEKFSSNFDDNTVSVQLRTWKDAPNRAPMFDKESFIKHMDNLPESNFFLSSDDQSIIDELSKRYPNRVTFYQKRITNYEPGSIDSTKKEFGQDCLIDMLLLGKNNMIIGSHISSFVECAWWFGGAKAEVIIVEPKIK